MGIARKPHPDMTAKNMASTNAPATTPNKAQVHFMRLLLPSLLRSQRTDPFVRSPRLPNMRDVACDTRATDSLNRKARTESIHATRGKQETRAVRLTLTSVRSKEPRNVILWCDNAGFGGPRRRARSYPRVLPGRWAAAETDDVKLRGESQNVCEKSLFFADRRV